MVMKKKHNAIVVEGIDEKKRIFQELHSRAIGGHSGETKTIDKVRQS